MVGCSPITFVKVGGSVITDKTSSKPDPKPDKIRLFCLDVKKALSDKHRLILAHGGGSFAHPVAARYRLGDGLESDTRIGFSETRYWLTQLSQILLKGLIEEGIPALVMHPSSFVYFTSSGHWKASLEPVKLALRYGMTPVLLGDVVLDEMKGSRIFSADDAPLILTSLMHTAIFLTEAEGVLDKSGRLLRRVGPRDLAMIGEIEETGEDVTGRMKEKVIKAIELARKGVKVRIARFSAEDDLIRALDGENGTEVIA